MHRYEASNRCQIKNEWSVLPFLFLGFREQCLLCVSCNSRKSVGTDKIDARPRLKGRGGVGVGPLE